MKRNGLPATLFAALAFAFIASARADTPKEAVGFFGTATGVVKSARPDGTSFVLTVTSAQADEKTSAIKDTAPMVGKDLTLGTRMPKTDGKAHPQPDDVAFIKSLKPGMTVTVTIFATRSDPATLRIIKPGVIATQPSP